MDLKKIADVKGYTAQARWYAANMEEAQDGEWTRAGWIKTERHGVKPVFRLRDGRLAIIVDGASHLAVAVLEVPAASVRATEEECW